jgi:hypothetical protein
MQVKGLECATFDAYQHIMLHGISSSLFLPIRVVNQRRTNQDATRESRKSPLATMAMKGVVEPNARYAKKNRQHGQDLQATATGQAGMGQD